MHEAIFYNKNSLYKYGEQIKGKSIMMNWGLTSIYNNRLFNTPAPIGYGVTTPQDLFPYFAMGDRFYTTNFGMNTQYNLFNPGYDPLVYHIAQNPQLAYTNPMLLGYTGGMQSMPTLDGIAAQRLSQQAPRILGTLESKLQGILESDQLTAEQKSRVQEKLDEVRALKEQFKKALSNPQVNILYALEYKMQDLQKEIAELGKKLAEEVQQAATENDDETTSASSSSDSTAETEEQKQNRADEAAGIVGLIFDAVDGIGTKNGQLEQTIAQINKDNIVDVFDAWNENYKAQEGSLVKRIYDDEYWYNGGNNYVKHMVDAFEEKARELGLYSKLIKEFTTVNSELNATWATDEAKVSEAMDKIHTTIKAKLEENAAKSDNKKADDDKVKTDKEQEAKDLFLSDMREIWKDENAEISDKVQYKDGKFVVRIEGKNYYGSDFNGLVKAVKDAGYDPEKYLKKQALRAAA